MPQAQHKPRVFLSTAEEVFASREKARAQADKRIALYARRAARGASIFDGRQPRKTPPGVAKIAAELGIAVCAEEIHDLEQHDRRADAAFDGRWAASSKPKPESWLSNPAELERKAIISAANQRRAVAARARDRLLAGAMRELEAALAG